MPVALHQAGFDNGGVALAMALTSDMPTTKEIYPMEAYLTYDSDGAG